MWSSEIVLGVKSTAAEEMLISTFLHRCDTDEIEFIIIISYLSVT